MGHSGTTMTKTVCEHCQHEWQYTGNAIKPTCPNCTLKTSKQEPAEVEA